MADTNGKVSQVVARPIRTAVQGTPAYVIVYFLNVWHIPSMNPEQFGGSVLFLTLLFSLLQPLIENKIGKGFLRTVPSQSVAPV